MAATAGDIEDFLNGPLVTWLRTCVKRPEALHVYESFHEGGPIIEVLLQIDPEPAQPVPTLANLQGLSIVASRINIFHCIIKNVKNIYEHELGQVVVALPDCIAMGRAPASQDALAQLKLLILLLLGCAVQGPTKEVFITRIKQLTLEAQHDIVECIKRVTDDQVVVLTQDWPEQSLQNIYEHLRHLSGERDTLFQQWVTDLGQEPSAAAAADKDGFESNHLAVELADWKARLRKQRQELEEKTELLAECREELEHSASLVGKLKAENADLLTEARRAKAYRDEADALRERAERADKLEAEAQRYRERLADTDFYRVRVAELREDNRVLIETREMLEAQLARARQRADHALALEGELLKLKQRVNDVTLERDADRERMQELLEENAQIQLVALENHNALGGGGGGESDAEETNSGDNSLSEQLSNNAQARALKLELENRKLHSAIEQLKESSLHESGTKLLEVEKDKKKLELRLEQVQEGFERLRQQNRDLDALFKESIAENRKLQATLDANKQAADRQAQDVHNERAKAEELERNIDALTKDKQRVQILSENIRKRADDAEKSLSVLAEQLHGARDAETVARDCQRRLEAAVEKLALGEKENGALHREVARLKQAAELQARQVDEHAVQLTTLRKELLRAAKDNELLAAQAEQKVESEQKLAELASAHAISTVTLDNLQRDLVTHKITNEKCRKILDRLGLDFGHLDDYDVNELLAKVFSNRDLVGSFVPGLAAPDQLGSLQAANEHLESGNARLQVEVATLASTVDSLQAQQTALQLANAALVAEKDELAKLSEAHGARHETLLHDQRTIRTLYEQLGGEYEARAAELEAAKRAARDLRIEVRTLKEALLAADARANALAGDKEALQGDAKSLANLRTEHSKLKDDFRNLFTANDRLKGEYKAMQEENKALKAEALRLRVGNSEMQGELNTRSDVLGGLQVENAKLKQHCDILVDMNHNSDADRHALMDHVSKLLSQYHSLLMHSLEDKQHYHMEEKHFTDKLNNLCRQKEKLEEKIMEHYRKLDNASGKKRGFLARHMRKATEAVNKISNRHRRSWHEDTIRLTSASGDSGGNESDSTVEDKPAEVFKRVPQVSVGSLKPRDEIALRRSHRNSIASIGSVANSNAGANVPEQSLSLGSVGTRRTVYLSEDDPAPPPTTTTTTSSVAPTPPPPLLVYNRISTVIGAPQTTNVTSSSAVGNDALAVAVAGDAKEKERNKANTTETDAKENATWYEYGCV